MYRPMQIPGVDSEQIAETDSLLRAELAADVKSFTSMTWEGRFHIILDNLWDVGVKLLVVVAIFVVGRWVIKRIIKLVDLIFTKRRLDPALRSFTRSLVSGFLWLVLFYLMIAWLGVNTSLFVALFAAAGLAIGMALSGVFQNFAGGVMILLLKPFRCGDWIETQGQAGSVVDIKLFNTILRTADNKTILIPNGSVSNNIINNFHVSHTRRLEWTIPLVVGTDFDAAKAVVMELLAAEGRVLTTRPSEVVVGKLNTNSLDVVARAWVNTPDAQDVFEDMNAVFYRTMPARGFNFPDPQQVVLARM